MATPYSPSSSSSTAPVYRAFSLDTRTIGQLSKAALKQNQIMVEFHDFKSGKTVQRICDVKKTGGKLKLTFETFHKELKAIKSKTLAEEKRNKKEQQTLDNNRAKEDAKFKSTQKVKLSLHIAPSEQLDENEFEMQAMNVSEHYEQETPNSDTSIDKLLNVPDASPFTKIDESNLQELAPDSLSVNEKHVEHKSCIDAPSDTSIDCTSEDSPFSQSHELVGSTTHSSSHKTEVIEKNPNRN